MKLMVFPTAAQVDDAVAQRFVALLEKKPQAVLGLATGGTPVGMYARLVELYRQGRISFAKARSFNLDEYIGLPEGHPCSYLHYMRENLFDHVDFAPGAARVPDGHAADIAAAALAYDRDIALAGGIDLQLLGIGHNGHIAFNEPGTPWDSPTRAVQLDESTRRANARFFEDISQVPTQALSMGMKPILQAKSIVMMVLGADKADILARIVAGPADASVPATALLSHPDATVYADAAAARGLTSREVG
nr:glucosamine-6-phosphate deaminase [bacterium]